MRYLTAGFFAVAITLMIACGGGSGDGGGQASSTSPQSTLSEEVGTEEFGMTEEELVTAIEQVEAGIATCMQDAGFEYIPIDAETFTDAMGSLGGSGGLSNEEYIAQYGYGFSTRPPAEDFRAGPDNDSIRNDLSAADQVAYTRTLLGDFTEATFVFALENEDFSNIGGCTKTAVESAFTLEQLNPTFKNPFDVLVANDPREIAALEDWSTCMKDKGYDFGHPDDAEREIMDRLDTLTGGKDPSTLSGADADALEQLQADERAIAAEDSICQDQFLRDVERQVEREISGQ